MSTEDQITIIPHWPILIDGEHAAAGVPVQCRARTAIALLQGGFARVAKAAARETTAPASPQLETADAAPAAETATAPAPAPRRSTKTKPKPPAS